MSTPSLATPTRTELRYIPTAALADRLRRIQPLRESTTAACLNSNTDRAFNAAFMVEAQFCRYRREWLRRGLGDREWEAPNAS